MLLAIEESIDFRLCNVFVWVIHSQCELHELGEYKGYLQKPVFEILSRLTDRLSAITIVKTPP